MRTQTSTIPRKQTLTELLRKLYIKLLQNNQGHHLPMIKQKRIEHSSNCNFFLCTEESKPEAFISLNVTHPETTFLCPSLHQPYLKPAKRRWLGQLKSLPSSLQQLSKDLLSTLTLCLLIPGIPQRWPKLLEDNKGDLDNNEDKPRFKETNELSEDGISLHVKEEGKVFLSYLQMENIHVFSALFLSDIERHVSLCFRNK